MIPTYLVDEIVLRASSPRLTRAKLKSLCRILEIDFDAALNPAPLADEAAADLSARHSAPFYGEIAFSFETRCGGDVRRVPGRIVYASRGRGDTGELDLTVSRCEALVWNTGEPAPEWVPLPDNALPCALVQHLTEAVEDAVIHQQREATSEKSDIET